MNNNAEFAFFSKWLKAPRQVASVAPSSTKLSQAMAACLPDLEGPVIELGAGTGPITRALLAAGVKPANLYVVEQDSEFCLHLRRRFPGITVLKGDAMHLNSLLNADARQPFSAIVSGLPLLAMPPAAHQRLLEQTLELTEGKGCYIQYSYGRRSPIKEQLLQDLHMHAHCVKRVWSNLPPAKVWIYQHRDQPFQLTTPHINQNQAPRSTTTVYPFPRDL